MRDLLIAREILRNIHKHKSSPQGNNSRQDEEISIIKLGNVVFNCIWDVIIEDVTGSKITLTRLDDIRPPGWKLKGKPNVPSQEFVDRVEQKLDKKNLSEDHKRITKGAANNLCKLPEDDKRSGELSEPINTVSRLSGSIHAAYLAIRQLEEDLTPLKLRSIMLSTRCDLCPA
ncbi:hypothetical protein ACFLYR_08245 [Chloroflexota bacterium]